MSKELSFFLENIHVYKMFGYILKTPTVCNQRDIVQIGTNKLNKTKKPNSTIYSRYIFVLVLNF